MPREKTKALRTVNIMFESSRIKEIHLAQAYEKLLPPRQNIIKKNGAESLGTANKFSDANPKEQ